MVMEPTPGTPLEMIQAQFFLHLLVALLHRPAALPQPHRPEPPCPLGQVAEGVLELPVGLLLDQQPEGFGPGTIAGLPALRRPDPQPGEPPGELRLGPL